MPDDHDQDGPARRDLALPASDGAEVIRTERGSPLRSMIGACLLGILAGAVGAVLDILTTVALGERFFLVPFLIGIGVGWGVRIGARGRGGWIYQAVAVGLTYLAIVAGHLPMVPVALGSDLGWTMAVLLLLMPLYRGVNSVVGLAMILLGLFQAWRLNRRPRPREPVNVAALTNEETCQPI